MSDIESRAGQPQASPNEQRPRDPEKWIRRATEKYRKYKYSLDFRPVPAFFELADPIVQAKRTLLGYDRLYVFWQVIRNVANVPGVVAEIGSFRGGSAYFVASGFKSTLGEEVPIHVFDTFEGHPQQAITEHDTFHVAGQFDSTSYEDVRAYLASFQLLQIHKGDVSASLPHLEEFAYRLVHIDTDLYQPTIACLEYFGPRMSPRGVIVVDDYASQKCAGVPKAVLEYLERTDAFEVWDMRTEQLMLVKR
jgi:O-methyltransferase